MTAIIYWEYSIHSVNLFYKTADNSYVGSTICLSGTKQNDCDSVELCRECAPTVRKCIIDHIQTNDLGHDNKHSRLKCTGCIKNHVTDGIKRIALSSIISKLRSHSKNSMSALHLVDIYNKKKSLVLDIQLLQKCVDTVLPNIVTVLGLKNSFIPSLKLILESIPEDIHHIKLRHLNSIISKTYNDIVNEHKCYKKFDIRECINTEFKLPGILTLIDRIRPFIKKPIKDPKIQKQHDDIALYIYNTELKDLITKSYDYKQCMEDTDIVFLSSFIEEMLDNNVKYCKQKKLVVSEDKGRTLERDGCDCCCCDNTDISCFANCITGCHCDDERETTVDRLKKWYNRNDAS
jgi:hypothetical protein